MEAGGLEVQSHPQLYAWAARDPPRENVRDRSSEHMALGTEYMPGKYEDKNLDP